MRATLVVNQYPYVKPLHRPENAYRAGEWELCQNKFVDHQIWSKYKYNAYLSAFHTTFELEFKCKAHMNVLLDKMLVSSSQINYIILKNVFN